MSEVEVIEPTEVLVPLSRDDAVKLDGRIRRLAKQAGDQLVQVGRLLDDARSGRIHEALGHASWTSYVADVLGGSLQLSGEARQAMVSMMAGEGMSVRAIAAATGFSKSTVSNDLAQVSNHRTPEHDSVDSGVQPLDTSPAVPSVVTGMDGKTYTKPQRKPRPPKKEPAPKEPVAKAPAVKAAPKKRTPDAKPRQVQVPTAYRGELKKLRPITTELEALTRDPRWGKALERFTYADRDTLDRYIQVLQVFRGAMGEHTAERKTA